MKKSKAQNIWICRHGNRIDFVDPSWKGVDPHLSPDGVIQAKETGARLRDEGIQNIFASPFVRAIETAHHIAEALDLSVKIEPGICEWLNPEWFSEAPLFPSLDERKKRFPRIDLEYLSIERPQYPEDSETALVRAAETAGKLADSYDGDFLMVGHGLSVMGMARGLMGGACTVSPGLCALVKIVRRNGTVEMELNGEDSHLSGGNSQSGRFN